MLWNKYIVVCKLEATDSWFLFAQTFWFMSSQDEGCCWHTDKPKLKFYIKNFLVRKQQESYKKYVGRKENSLYRGKSFW